MAEIFLYELGRDEFESKNAGIERGVLNHLALMGIGIYVLQNSTKKVFGFYYQGKQYSFVVTVRETNKRKKIYLNDNSKRALGKDLYNEGS